MPSDKRQRKKENAAARREAELAAQRQALLRRRIITIAIVGAVFVGVVFLVTRGGGSSEKKTSTASGSTTTARRSTTTAPSTTQAAAAEATCPKADGSSPKQGRFKSPFPASCTSPAKTYTATMETDVGKITIALDPKKAPKTVNNFVSLARYHYFDGVVFHRVIPGFVLQGGDPTGTGSGGPGYQFGDELPKSVSDYKAGSLAMANSGPNTNGSQFFIVTSDGGGQQLGTPNYSLFGQVTAGMDVVKKIEADGGPGPEGKPKVTHKMVKVTIAET